MAEQKVIDKAKAWADKEYDELRYSKCEKNALYSLFTNCAKWESRRL